MKQIENELRDEGGNIIWKKRGSKLYLRGINLRENIFKIIF